MDFSSWSPEYFIANQPQCLEILNTDRNRLQIPYLNHANLDGLSDNVLVRFRGMVQDMFSPEIYLEKYEVLCDENSETRVQNGKYRDVFHLKKTERVNNESACNKFGDRRGYFIVSIPGINTWVNEYEKSKFNTVYEKLNGVCDQNGTSTKRKFEPSENEDKMDFDEAGKKVKDEDKATKNSMVVSPEFLLNSPISTRPSKACIVKLYAEMEEYELGSIIDVIGFLSVDPSLDGTTQEIDENNFETAEEIQSLNPPPSLIPRLHAISIHRLKHYNPLLEVAEDAEISGEPNDIFKDLHLVLTQALFGDAIAAEYLICHLISSVYARTEVAPLGKFTLNISHFPESVLIDHSYTEDLYSIIEMLMPASHYFPATLDNLRDLQFFPSEDLTTNRLKSGLLQLAPHTHFVFDETKLSEGQLGESGYKAVTYLSNVINSQQVKCIFKFFATEYNCDIPILILSERKSILPKDFHVPLKIDDEQMVRLIKEGIVAARHFLQSKITPIRRFLTEMRVRQFETTSEMSSMIQEDFVEMRREKNVNAEYLHNLMVLSRLIGLSKGKTHLDKESWKRAIFLENEREARIVASTPVIV